LHDLGQPIRIDARVVGVRTAPARKQSGKGGSCHLQFIRSTVHLEPDFAFNSFSNPPFLQFIRSANALLLRR